MLNLIRDPWIPIVRRSGARERIPPWRLTDGHDTDPIEAVASPRPDFDGAITELLIALAQTFFPATERAWRERWREVPSPKTLKAHFEPFEPAFELRGEGARAFQDLELPAEVDKRIGQLLMDEPGDKSIKENVDFFVERGRADGLCEPCAAAALVTLQTYAPSGGAGHRTGLRGGGPMTSIVAGDTLWQTAWLNVIPKDRLRGEWPDPKPDDAAVFAWLSECRTSEKKGGTETLPTDVHPMQAFFGVPRRVRLAFEPARADERCSLCHRASDVVSRGYTTKNYGTNYAGNWRHPLSPHRAGKGDEWIPRHPGPQGIPYHHWLGVVVADTESKQAQLPADVVENAKNASRAELTGDRLVVDVFGYDMDNMKARSWQRAGMPIVSVSDDPDCIGAFEDAASGLVKAARDVAGYLASAVKDVFGDHADQQGAKRRLYAATEAAFYSALRAAAEAFANDFEASRVELGTRWRQELWTHTEGIFDSEVSSGHFQNRDPRAIADAHNRLRGRVFGKKIRAHLGLPDPPKKTKKTSK